MGTGRPRPQHFYRTPRPSAPWQSSGSLCSTRCRRTYKGALPDDVSREDLPDQDGRAYRWRRIPVCRMSLCDRQRRYPTGSMLRTFRNVTQQESLQLRRGTIQLALDLDHMLALMRPTKALRFSGQAKSTIDGFFQKVIMQRKYWKYDCLHVPILSSH